MKNWLEIMEDMEETDSLFNFLTEAFKTQYKQCVERLCVLENPIDPKEQEMLKDFLLALYSLEEGLYASEHTGVVEFFDLKDVVISNKKPTSVCLNLLKQATIFVLTPYPEDVFELEHLREEYKYPTESDRNATTVADTYVVEILGDIFTSIFESELRK